MARATMFLVLGVLAALAGARPVASAPITGTVDVFLDGSLHAVLMHGSGLFGSVPSGGVITEVATASLEVPAESIPWEWAYTIPVPLPVYQDATTASIDDVFFTIVPYATSLRCEGGQTFELTYTGGPDIDVYRSLNYGAPLCYGILKFIVKVWAVRTVPSLAAEAPVTKGVAVSQNRPNPFRSPTAIAFDVPRAGHVRLEVFDVSGKRVALVLDGVVDAGSHTVVWDGRDSTGARLKAGQYYYRLATDEGTQAKKMILLD